MVYKTDLFNVHKQAIDAATQQKFFWTFLQKWRHITILTRWKDLRLLCKGKDDCMADLLFQWIGFNQTNKSFANVYVAMQLNPIQTNGKSYFPLWSKWLFFAYSKQTSFKTAKHHNSMMSHHTKNHKLNWKLLSL